MPGEGQLLYGFVRALKPEIILEIGTSYGGSTLHLAAGCKDNDFGRVYTVEIDLYRQSQAKYYVELAGVESWVEFYNSIPDLPQIDFAFLDAGHTQKEVAQYLIDIKDKLSKNALVLVHDATWRNHVVEAANEQGFNYLILPSTSHAGMAILWL